MVALRSLDAEPLWMQEPEPLWERRDIEREARLQQMEDEAERPYPGTSDSSDTD